MDTPQTPPPDAASSPTILVIFGVTGDLAKRYLLPSLYHLFSQGLIHEKTEIIGISRRELDMEALFNSVSDSINKEDNASDPVVMAHMHSRTRAYQLDMDSAEAFQGLATLLNDIEAENGVCMNRLYYLAIPPAAYTQVVGHMGAAGLNGSCQHGSAMTRLLVEKPFGHDLASAEALIAATGAAFAEEQVFRIDHYLAKETAQNILTFRFQNPLFESIWNSRHIRSIDIEASEKIGIEGRAAFYEQQGALRDFIQNHLLQLLAIVAMDKPAALDSDHIHAAKLQLLQAVNPITAAQVASQARRGQYEGYRQEVNNPQSFVETFAQLRTTIGGTGTAGEAVAAGTKAAPNGTGTPPNEHTAGDRWNGLPVTIGTGKALSEKQTTITLTFGTENSIHTNVLQFRIQPNEGIQLSLFAKKPGFDQELQKVTMDFSYNQNFNGEQPTAYERVLIDAIRGDRTLFTTGQEVLAAWRIVDAVVQAWTQDGTGLQYYQPGVTLQSLAGDTPAEQ